MLHGPLLLPVGRDVLDRAELQRVRFLAAISRYCNDIICAPCLSEETAKVSQPGNANDTHGLSRPGAETLQWGVEGDAAAKHWTAPVFGKAAHGFESAGTATVVRLHYLGAVVLITRNAGFAVGAGRVDPSARCSQHIFGRGKPISDLRAYPREGAPSEIPRDFRADFGDGSNNSIVYQLLVEGSEGKPRTHSRDSKDTTWGTRRFEEVNIGTADSLEVATRFSSV